MTGGGAENDSDALQDQTEVARLQRALDRERRARREAEDIAERTTARLYRTLASVEQQHRSLRELSTSAAPDLKNPIARLSGFVQLLGTDTLPEALRDEIIRRMAVTVRYTVDLMDGLFEVIRSGSSDEPAVAINLATLVATVGDELLARHPQATMASTAEGEVWGPPNELRRLLDNLVENAARYAGHEQVSITVSVTTRTAHDLTLMIADDGVGVPQADRERIFTIFQRGTQTLGLEGQGIGLAVCRRIARAAGGDLWLDDGPGPAGGAAFMLRLPSSA